MQPDVVMVGTVIGQKDCGLAPPAAVGMLMQLVASVHEPGAAEQCAACIALGDWSMLLQHQSRDHVCATGSLRGMCAGAATCSVGCEQRCVALKMLTCVVLPRSVSPGGTVLLYRGLKRQLCTLLCEAGATWVRLSGGVCTLNQ